MKVTQEVIDDILHLYVDEEVSCRQIGMKYNLSHNQISKILKENNVYNPNRIQGLKYKQKDINIISDLYSKGKWEEIFKLYPHSSKQTIYSLMSKYNVSHSSTWTKEDLDILKKNYYLPDDEINQLLDNRHSVISIATKRQRLRLTTRSFWSDEDISLLIQGYSESIDKACELLPNRSRITICEQAKKLGLNVPKIKFNQAWSLEEDQYLKDNWMMQSDIILSKNLNRTFRSVKWRREYLGLYRQDKDEKHYKLLSKYLRRNTYAWKRKIKKQYNEQCILTGSKNVDVHHYISVNVIVKDILQEIGLEYCDDFSQFTEEQLKVILDKFKIKQEEIGGVCISNELHTLFHKLYGFQNNKEQFDQFCSDFKTGIYDELLKSA